MKVKNKILHVQQILRLFLLDLIQYVNLIYYIYNYAPTCNSSFKTTFIGNWFVFFLIAHIPHKTKLGPFTNLKH